MADAERPPCPLWAKIIATGGGVGYIPFAPGTFGSLLGLFIGLVVAFVVPRFLYYDYCFNLNLGLSECIIESASFLFEALPVLLIFIIGLIAANTFTRKTGIKDPKEVVVDEIVGQLITLLGISIVTHDLRNWIQIGNELGFAFILFRTLDIWKPWPIRWFERLPGGWGIMMDDVVAGIFGAIILATLVHFHWLPGM